MSEYRSNRDFVRASKWSDEDRRTLLELWMSISRPHGRGSGIYDVPELLGANEDGKGSSKTKSESSWREWSPKQKRREMYLRIVRLLNHGPSAYQTSVSEVAYLAGEQNVASEYHSFQILKRSGSHREITAPSELLKRFQQQLLIVLTILSRRHRTCHGFEPGRSIVTHAKNHVGKEWVLTVDLKDFFPTITARRVFGMFMAKPFGLSTDAARFFTNVACVKGSTPQGAPTSPLISNLICRRLDSRLFKLARERGFQYSRYADDLAFSTNRFTDNQSFLSEVQALIEQEGFCVNALKTKVRHRSRRQVVTGLVVNKKLNIPREKLRNMRALLRNINAHGWRSQIARSEFDVSQREQYRINNKELKTELNMRPEPTATSYLKKNELWQRQNQEHFLIGVNELTSGLKQREITSVDTDAKVTHLDEGVSHLQLRIYGILLFFEHVRGTEDEVCRRLKAEFKSTLKDSKGYKGQPIPFKKRSAQRQLEDLIHKHTSKEGGPLNKEDLLDDLLNTNKDVIEYELIRARSGQSTSREVIKELRQVAINVDKSLEDLENFFLMFSDDAVFRGLLHGAEIQEDGVLQIGGNTNRISVNLIMENVAAVVNRQTLPIELFKEANMLVEKVRAWIEEDSKRPQNTRVLHPFNDPNFRDQTLLPFKRCTKYDSADGYGLMVERLIDECSKLGAVRERKIVVSRGTNPPGRKDLLVHFEGESPQFYAYVPGINRAIITLLSVMIQHTSVNEIRVMVSSEGPELAPTHCTVRIMDVGGRFEVAPELMLLVKGESARVLDMLRGQAEWSIRAPFKNGEFYSFDVLRNKRTKITADDVNGVTHDIRIPCTL